MSAIKEIREITGLSQYELADWLGVSRSMIYLAEKGKRNLSSAANIKLSATLLLQQSVKNKKKEDAAGENKDSIRLMLIEEHKKMIRSHESKVKKVEKDISKLRSARPKAVSKAALLKALQEQDLTFFNKSSTDKKWLEIMEWLSRHRLTGFTTGSEALLLEKKEIHLAYAGIHRERLNALLQD